MDIVNDSIDGGKAFDWGRTSNDYAKYRDIYPKVFYDNIVKRGLCIEGQNVLDLGTGTGVFPRNMYEFGAKWTGTDISENQIKQAKLLAQQYGMNIDFKAVSTENVQFPDQYFDVITACQCFWYFDHKNVMPKLSKMLKKDGRLVVLYMAWLPFEDKIAGKSEKLVLKYSPNWTGAGETRKPVYIPDVVYDTFEMVEHEEYDVYLPFTRETWNGRMKACRGVGASLSESDIEKWEIEHKNLLERIAPEKFEILHYVSMAVLKKR